MYPVLQVYYCLDLLTQSWVIRDLITDMNQDEERLCKGNFLLVYSPSKQKVCLMDLKNSKVQVEHFNELLELAEQGCKMIADTMRRHLLQHYVSKLVTSH